MIAVLQTGGKQYIVKEKDIIRVEKIAAKDRKKDKVTFSNVLLVSDSKKTEVGTPHVKAKIEATIVRDDKAKKVRVVKYKPKIRYVKTTGHRQQYTELKIDKITV